MVRKRRGDDHVGGFENTAGEIVRERRVISELQVGPVFLRACSERDHDDRLRPERIGSLLPRDVAEAKASRRLPADGGALCDRRHRDKNDEHSHAHAPLLGERDCTLNP